jgi:hypothetical protein
MLKRYLLCVLAISTSPNAVAATYLFNISGVVVNGAQFDSRRLDPATPWKNGESFSIDVVLDLGPNSANVATPFAQYAIVAEGAGTHQATMVVGGVTEFSTAKGEFEISRDLSPDLTTFKPGGFNGYTTVNSFPDAGTKASVSVTLPTPLPIAQGGDYFSSFSYTSSPSEYAFITFGLVAPNAFRPDVLEYRTVGYDSTQGQFKVQATLITPNAGAVPEPSTWAFAIVGFGLVGAGVRRRRSKLSVGLG